LHSSTPLLPLTEGYKRWANRTKLELRCPRGWTNNPEVYRGASDSWTFVRFPQNHALATPARKQNERNHALEINCFEVLNKRKQATDHKDRLLGCEAQEGGGFTFRFERDETTPPPFPFHPGTVPFPPELPFRNGQKPNLLSISSPPRST